MSDKVLNIIESAYRATLEEQDDTVVWISHALRGAGAKVDLYLKGSAVNYAVAGQTPGLSFGRWEQSHPPSIDEDLASLQAKGGRILVSGADLDRRGIDADALIDGVTVVGPGQLPGVLGDYDHVWHW